MNTFTIKKIKRPTKEEEQKMQKAFGALLDIEVSEEEAERMLKELHDGKSNRSEE